MTLISATSPMIPASPSCCTLKPGTTPTDRHSSPQAEKPAGTEMNEFEPSVPPTAEIDGFRVVAIGGGTGLSTLLKGLKRYVPPAGQLYGELGQEAGAAITELTAVVTVTDDGGSSGLLRREFNILPPGDIRNRIGALSEDEALLSRLFQFRFPGESQLGGH